MADLTAEADAIAVQAKAIKHCEIHDDVWITRGDPDANKHAYALANIRWDRGDMGCTRPEFMDAIKEVIDQAADQCPSCAKIRDE
jgi:hypothetical protein